MKIKDLDHTKLAVIAQDSLFNADGGEIFLEDLQSEFFMMDNGILSNVEYKTRRGFGFRGFSGESFVLAHSSDISEEKIKEAGSVIKKNLLHSSKKYININTSNVSYYQNNSPLDDNLFLFKEKITLMQEINDYIVKKAKNLAQASIHLLGGCQNVIIIDNDGNISRDTRPIVRINISVVLTDGYSRFESGYEGCGGRFSYDKVVNSSMKIADSAIRKAEINLESVSAPSGEMCVVLSNGWPGVILHEAIGHGLEGDFNRKKTSVFSDLIGTNVASPGVTVVDDGTIKDARGSINIDDEGTPSSRTTLIENGKLVGYINDKMNANLMNQHSTGNGRRESYLHLPLPRMTNTYMLPGTYSPEEIISSVKEGIYAVSLGGGQVDITSGKFVFATSEAYSIKNGKIAHPVKGVTLIGSGEKILKEIDMVANDWSLDPGIGTCSKNGQNLPVGVGQPTIRIRTITVGGSNE